MNKSIIYIVLSFMFVSFAEAALYADIVPSWGDPNKGTYWYNNQQVSHDEFLAAITADLLRDNPGTVLGGAASQQGQATSPAANTQTAAPAASTKTAISKEKLTVYFTDAYGRVIGTSQVTKGTTIADSQFVQSVEDCDGLAFDSWDYDGRVIEHETVVRALYK